MNRLKKEDFKIVPFDGTYNGSDTFLLNKMTQILSLFVRHLETLTSNFLSDQAIGTIQNKYDRYTVRRTLFLYIIYFQQYQ